MNRSMAGFRSVEPSRVVTPKGFTLKRVSGLLAVAGALVVCPAFARDPAAADVKPINKGQAARTQVQPEPTDEQGRRINRGQAVRGQLQSEQVVLPECLEKLNLSVQQQDQVKEIVRNYDGSIVAVWKQFSNRYMQAICMETALMAAIEDILSEAQRQQVRDQRRKTAVQEKAMAATSTKVNQSAVKPNEEAAKPAIDAEKGIAAAGVSLNDDQEAAADKVQEKYHAQLRSINRDIQGLHTRLLSLEADKLVEIEKVLTKEQLAQLREHRQNAPAAPKVVITRTEPTKAE